MQHALFLMRTPRIQKMTLNLEKKENEELIATIHSETGDLCMSVNKLHGLSRTYYPKACFKDKESVRGLFL